MAERHEFPEMLALFPLRDATLLPRARLPLNIFEPRYLAMVDHALGHQRLIGMIRPRFDEDDVNPPLYDIGCAGRIASFSETGDGRYLIELVGVSRFRLASDRLASGNFRLGKADWGPFYSDLSPPSSETDSMRGDLLGHLKTYLDMVGLSADWNTIEDAPMESIVNSVSMSCPFEADEQQALLEAPTLGERIRVLMTILDMAVAEQSDAEGYDPPDRLQ